MICPSCPRPIEPQRAAAGLNCLACDEGVRFGEAYLERELARIRDKKGAE